MSLPAELHGDQMIFITLAEVELTVGASLTGLTVMSSVLVEWVLVV